MSEKTLRDDEVEPLRRHNQNLMAENDAAYVQSARFRADNERLRTDLGLWQQRFGDAQATIGRRDAEIERLRAALQEIAELGAWGVGAISIARRALGLPVVF